jgi:thiol-activated cytolysin
MKTNLFSIKILSQVLIFSLSLVICFSCSEDDGLEKQLIEEEEAEKINQELMQLQSFSQPDEISAPELLNEDDPIRDNEFECIVKKYKAAPGYDEMMILDPTSDVIYPGAMLKGESIPTGEYIGINGGRAPITLSVSLENIDGKSYVEIEKPVLSEVRNEVSNLLKQGVTGSTPAELSFTVEEVYSEEHLDIALGSNYRSRSKDISASFDFESSKYKY